MVEDQKIVNCDDKARIKRIAFVFSCPGQEEEKTKKLVSGMTGCNLEKLLKNIKDEIIKEDFKDRYDFTITNSHNEVHYKALNNRTEPLNSKIKEVKNLERLINELKEAEIIICFGKKSKYALSQIKNQLKENTKVLHSRHLGLMSLNQIELEKEITNKTDERIKIVAQKIIDDYKQKSAEQCLSIEFV
ncbi:hypothetical protein [Flavobacterium solisilvae]|uniref:Uracil-DNA glycosylase-like domain-containing protein n=1 Tax=Flavobacterium solisilvae TaxID=1852019 RepID=A0ABX1QRB3_9FLAO|nr:hypothetical protein [Flavobacterium solisilvae]NMH23980.1 hypothetical protein [Flavobacterium solisilvae]